MRKQTLAMMMAALAAACGGGSPSAPSAPPTGARTVERIQVTAPGPIEVGTNTQLQLTALYSDGSKAPISGSDVRWDSLTPGLVTVDAGGVARGIKYGKATIQASFANRVGKLEADVLGRPVKVTVQVVSFECIEDCDATLNGKGDFVYRVSVELTGLTAKSWKAYETAGYPSEGGIIRLGPGETRAIDRSNTFDVRDQSQAIEVDFCAVEWDAGGQDSRLDGKCGYTFFSYNEQGGWGPAPGGHTILLGSGTCLVRLHYNLAFDYASGR